MTMQGVHEHFEAVARAFRVEARHKLVRPEFLPLQRKVFQDQRTVLVLLAGLGPPVPALTAGAVEYLQQARQLADVQSAAGGRGVVLAPFPIEGGVAAAHLLLGLAAVDWVTPHETGAHPAEPVAAWFDRLEYLKAARPQFVALADCMSPLEPAEREFLETSKASFVQF